MTTRNITLTAKQDALVDQMIRSGAYETASEAIGEALLGLQQRLEADESRRDLLRPEIKAGIDALDRGAFTDVSDEALDDALDDLARARG
jgi:antitoxin ParD1/3/4